MIDFLKAQLQHQLTKEWLDIVAKYAKLSNYKNALDIGTGAGLTAYTIAVNGSGKVYTMDVEPRLEAPKIFKSEKLDQVKAYKMSSDDYFAKNKLVYQLVVVDGNHDYKNVIKDVKNAWQAMDHGYIVCDDYNRYNGTHRALDDVNLPNKHIENDKMIIVKD